jgi:protein-S-isoprenylcysteine O-methyltransferase Ste14
VLLIKNLLFTLIVPGTAAIYLPLALTPDQMVSWGITAAASMLLFLSGATAYTWCVWDFASFGRGTPLPLDAPKKLVIRGLYRYSRNPMYVGVLLVILGWAALFRSWGLVGYALLIATGFQLFIVLYEEPHLQSVFGPSYAEYCARVGRWLPRRWPGVD